MTTLRYACAGLMASAALHAQSTQALVAGTVTNAISGSRISGATLSYENLEIGRRAELKADAAGEFAAPLLAPGPYRFRCEAGGAFQALEIHRIEIAVGGRHRLDFELRPIGDLWEEGQPRNIVTGRGRKLVSFYGPDVALARIGSFEPLASQDARLDSSLSYAIRPSEIAELPLPGRDAYALLLLQPHVTSLSTTARGLGFSVNGMRPGASRFLLDGVENNHYLITGPMAILAPEHIQEYRISTANYSAEFGASAGFLANAVTRSGGNLWHGIAYASAKNERLSANDPGRRYAGLARAPLKEYQPGFHAGGPVLREKLFVSGSAEYFDSRGVKDARTFTVPAAAYLDSLNTGLAGSQGANLLGQFRPMPVSATAGARTARIEIAPPELVKRRLVSQQLDWQPEGPWRFKNRVALSRFDRPQFQYSPYPDFTSDLEQSGSNIAFMATRARGQGALEIRGSIGRDALRFGRAHPGIPALFSDDGVSLPGANYVPDYDQHGTSAQIIANAMEVRGKHVWKIGGQGLVRRQGLRLDALQGEYRFRSFDQFLAGIPRRYSTGVSRLDAAAKQLRKPVPDRRYRHRQGGLFAQDSYQPLRRLTVQFGGLAEYAGQPLNSGSQSDTVLQFGRESDFSERLANAQLGLSPRPISGQSLRAAVRAGFAFSLVKDGSAVVRGGYGDFFDPSFDNLWLNTVLNQYMLGEAGIAPGQAVDFLKPATDLYSLTPQAGRIAMTASDFRRLLAFGPSIAAPRVRSYFLAFQQAISPRWTVEATTTATTGRKLLTTDIVNRPFFNGSRSTYPRRDLPEVSYRDGDGSSNYHGLAFTARYKASRASLRASYTWSHSIDNQSDPLQGDFDFLFTQTGNPAPIRGDAAFSRARDFRADRGSSDFDQRHNFVIFSVWTLPSLFTRGAGRYVLDGWKFAQIAAVRSGSPFSATGAIPSSLARETIYNNRAQLLCAGGHTVNLPLPQGRQLLNAACFDFPRAGQLGSSGRNAFAGPGSANLDLSISRTFPLRGGREGRRIVVRADAYNALNHANLNNPESSLNCSQPGDCGGGVFGAAQFGKKETGSAFPALKPFVESGRQIQLIVRFEF